MTFLVWLLGSSAGRMVALGGIACLVMALVVARAWRGGVHYEQTKQLQKRLENLTREIAINKDVRSLDADERRRRVDRWLRADDE